MTNITAIGSSKFLLGFALAGVRTITLSSDSDVEQEILSQEGIVVVEQELYERLDPGVQSVLAAGTEPVVIPLGDEYTSERLGASIRSTLGFDLFR